MKSWRIVTILLLCLVLVGAISCNPFGSEEETTQQLVQVVRGDLIISVSGSGNIEVVNEAKLAFGVGGRIDKIYAKEGNEVSEGEVLAKLETGALELALAQAEVAQEQSQLAVTQVEVAVTQAEVAVTQAEISLEMAKFNLDRMEDVTEAKDVIDDAEYELNFIKMKLKETQNIDSPSGQWEYWLHQKGLVEQRLAEARQELAELLVDPDYTGLIIDEVVIKMLQVEVAKQSLELAKQSLESAKQSLESAQKSVKLTRQSLTLARQQLDEATITAPFDGVVAKVNVDEKDTVYATTTIVHLIDPNSMELNVQVDEIDVTEVEPGQRAIIEVDALPALLFEGKVSSISLLPTREGGVILYDVKVAFDVAEGIGLRAGMSATADIIIAEWNDVLLVPERAIKQDSQGNFIVGVMVNEQIEERTVVTGISDGFQTEILDGLEEGEVIERRAKPR